MGGRWKYYVGGFLAIVVAVITWQLEAELVQGLQEPDSPNYYNKVSNTVHSKFPIEYLWKTSLALFFGLVFIWRLYDIPSYVVCYKID